MTFFHRAIVTVPHDSGLPEDAIVNTFAYKAEDVVTQGGAAVAFNAALNTFYGALSGLFSTQYDWDAGVVEYIDLADDVPRLPFTTGVLDLPAIATTEYDLPAEVSICLSFKGSTSSGDNPRRRRGRIYLGPLQAPAVDLQSISTARVDAIVAAAVTLRDGALYDWCVYSRYTHHAVPVGRSITEEDESGNKLFPEVPDALPAAFVPITTVWADNAWDTQRRRGTAATYRKTL